MKKRIIYVIISIVIALAISIAIVVYISKSLQNITDNSTDSSFLVVVAGISAFGLSLAANLVSFLISDLLIQLDISKKQSVTIALQSTTIS